METLLMDATKNCFTFTVPLTLDAHQIAREFYSQQSNYHKAKQVYLNTLAVYAVDFYLQCLGVATNREVGHSWNPLMQVLADVADLAIADLGKLECRPVLPDAETAFVPPEVGTDRIGYVAVRLDRALTEATLLGFLPAVNTEEIPLSQFQSLEALLEHLNRLTSKPVNLSRWLQNVFDGSWEAIETLFEPSQEIAFRYRGVPRPSTVQRGKRLSLESMSEPIVLSIALQPTDSSEINISVEMHPTGERSYLPQHLQLVVLDEEGEAVMQAVAKSAKTIQLNFSGEPDERFAIQVALGDFSHTEVFQL